MLMDLETLQWDPELCQLMGVPITMLPTIRSSSEVFCEVQEFPSCVEGVKIAGVLGDQVDYFLSFGTSQLLYLYIYMYIYIYMFYADICHVTRRTQISQVHLGI
jgi:hypothetical protein